MFNQNQDYIRNNTNLKAPNSTQYISKETWEYRLNQIKKIHQDIKYFAQNYFYIISLDQGKKIISLYPKQAELIKQMTSKRRLICLATRQCGKCLDINSIIKVRNKKTGEIEELTLGQFFAKHKNPNTLYIQIPTTNIKSNSNKKSDIIQRKYQQQYTVQDYQIWTDTGWQDIDMVSKTIPYQKYSIITEKNKKLSGADKHIVFDENYEEIFLDQLKIGNKIITEDGIEKIIEVKKENKKQNMYDLSIASENHRFYSNGILNHNSTSYSIYLLWYCLINTDKNVLICANKLKTAVDILSRIKMAYQMLPNWLKPGIVTWNKTTIEFSNGCKITAEATTESSGRGGSVNCLVLDEFAFLKPNIEEGFMASVFPVVSSSKTSQIIIVSTPNGMNNQYYKFWSQAKLNIKVNNDVGWFPVEINWWDVPGRDQKWKQQQLASFDYNYQKFQQEYGNCVCGDTKIQIFNTETNKIQQISIEKLHSIL